MCTFTHTYLIHGEAVANTQYTHDKPYNIPSPLTLEKQSKAYSTIPQSSPHPTNIPTLKNDQVPKYQDSDVPSNTPQIWPLIKPKRTQHKTQLRKRVEFCHRQNHRPHTRQSIKNNSGA